MMVEFFLLLLFRNPVQNIVRLFVLPINQKVHALSKPEVYMMEFLKDLQ